MNEALKDNPMPQDGTETEDEYNVRMSRLYGTIQGKYFRKINDLSEYEYQLPSWKEVSEDEDDYDYDYDEDNREHRERREREERHQGGY